MGCLDQISQDGGETYTPLKSPILIGLSIQIRTIWISNLKGHKNHQTFLPRVRWLSRFVIWNSCYCRIRLRRHFQFCCVWYKAIAEKKIVICAQITLKIYSNQFIQGKFRAWRSSGRCVPYSFKRLWYTDAFLHGYWFLSTGHCNRPCAINSLELIQSIEVCLPLMSCCYSVERILCFDF